MKLSDYKPEDKPGGESVLLVGPPKAGKTELVATLAEDFTLWWFDLDNGIRTVLNSSRIKKESLANIEYFAIPDTRPNPVGISTIMKIFTGQECKICEEHGMVTCLACMGKPTEKKINVFDIRKLGKKDIIVVDSLSQLSDSAYFQVVGPNVDADAEWKHYDAWNQRMSMVLSMVQQCRTNVCFIGHVKPMEMPDGTTKLCPVGGTTKFSPNLPRYFGHVLYADVSAGRFVVGSKQDFKVNAIMGTRSDLKYDGVKVKLRDFFL